MKVTIVRKPNNSLFIVQRKKLNSSFEGEPSINDYFRTETAISADENYFFCQTIDKITNLNLINVTQSSLFIRYLLFLFDLLIFTCSAYSINRFKFWLFFTFLILMIVFGILFYVFIFIKKLSQ